MCGTVFRLIRRWAMRRHWWAIHLLWWAMREWPFAGRRIPRRKAIHRWAIRRHWWAIFAFSGGLFAGDHSPEGDSSVGCSPLPGLTWGGGVANIYQAKNHESPLQQLQMMGQAGRKMKLHNCHLWQRTLVFTWEIAYFRLLRRLR